MGESIFRGQEALVTSCVKTQLPNWSGGWFKSYNAAPKVRRLDNSLAITRESFHILILAGYTEGVQYQKAQQREIWDNSQ